MDLLLGKTNNAIAMATLTFNLEPFSTSTPWLMDYSSIHHLISDAFNIDQYVPYNVSDKFIVSKGSSLSIINHDHKSFTINSYNLHLSNILHTPNM